MSKKIKKTPVDLEKTVMAKVKSGEITMKPRWYFVLGSLSMIGGLVGLTMMATFLTNLIFFLIRRRGPMQGWRLQFMLSNFPWWVPILAILGIVLGVWLLKKYDFSYQKNFGLIVVGFIIAIFLTGFLIDFWGLNDFWSRHEPMRRFYQQLEKEDLPSPGRGSVRGVQFHRN
ncbi:MAG: hypothetical protein A2383_01340 [Candidatus Pacebacteria bacterium RIFOXYB1_FULL_39_46]|nr:MAG: hypothetical protein A2383_01340 [Candidatus Pacebacteria bacterium RIFOXYB1_FULL_39_46]OGJ39035.1 MAG: hypothetical protein A2182_01760 [Candidatus Pacebacteria bacterium RIFOXYA1_FULL_38_18]OGJ40006.1 MAG: hypothetical protein A2582_01285 [Candidatus Pacebacteria bacterium RIFOXYD1_FULL_39_27]OGJ40732.1 MAG: hypothetical protein A2411_00410 [Candidatus Pacebacteria bacterium RIFOXYC1_FULL_39_21]